MMMRRRRWRRREENSGWLKWGRGGDEKEERESLTSVQFSTGA
jgi:hypothetical protein